MVSGKYPDQNRQERRKARHRKARRRSSGTLAAVAGLALLTGSAGPTTLLVADAKAQPDDALDSLPDDSFVAPPHAETLPQPPVAPPTDPGGQIAPANFEAGIPSTVLAAYKKAEETQQREDSDCHVKWSLLAGIGKVESNHARGGNVDAEGNTVSPILGPTLNGNGFAAIGDHDNGKWDGDSRWDRAVGPMQFIPSTWQIAGADGNGDGKSNPNNVYDATLAAAKYLCARNRDLSNPTDLRAAIFSYNHSDEYVRTVMRWAEAYANGVNELPNDTSGGDTSNVAGGPPKSSTENKPKPSKDNPPTPPPKPKPNPKPPKPTPVDPSPWPPKPNPDRPSNLVDGTGVAIGPANAKATIVVYEDFNCPECKSFEESSGKTLEKLAADRKARVIYRPIAALDSKSTTKYSTRALNAAGCAADAGVTKFAALHRELFANQPPEGGAGLSDAELIKLGDKAGISGDEFSTCVKGRRFEAWTKKVTEAASEAGVNGNSPIVLVNGKPLQEPTPEAIEAAVKDAGA